MYRVFIQNDFEPYTETELSKVFNTLEEAEAYFRKMYNTAFFVELSDDITGDILDTN